MGQYWNKFSKYPYTSDNWLTVRNIWNNEMFDNAFDITYRSIPAWAADNSPANNPYYPLYVQSQMLRIPFKTNFLDAKLCTNLHTTVKSATSGFIYYAGAPSSKPEGLFFRADELNIESAPINVDADGNVTNSRMPFMNIGNSWYYIPSGPDNFVVDYDDLFAPDYWTNTMLLAPDDITFTQMQANATFLTNEPFLDGSRLYYIAYMSHFGFEKNQFIIAKEENQPFDYAGVPYFKEYSDCVKYVNGELSVEDADNYEELVSGGFRYDVYIEGNNMPVVNIVWKNDFIRDSGIDTSDWKFEMVVMHSADTTKRVTLTEQFQKGRYSTTYRELLKLSDVDNYNTVVSGGREYTNGYSSGFMSLKIRIVKPEPSVGSDVINLTLYDTALNGTNAQGTNVGTGSSSVLQYRFTPTTGHMDRRLYPDFSVDNPINCLGVMDDDGYSNSKYGYKSSVYVIANNYVRAYTQQVVNISSTKDGSVVYVHKGSGIEDDYTYPSDDSDTKIVEDDELFTGILTNSYAITKQQCQQIGGKLWSETFINNIRLVNSNPIESIVSVRRYPFRVSADNDSTSVFIGNVDMGIDGRENFKSNRITLATFDFPAYYNSYLDFNPYSHFYLFLPFVGLKELDIEKYYNRKGIQITYIIDYVTGDCIVAIMLADNTITDLYSGSIGVELQLSNSGLNELQRKYATALVNAGVDIAGTVATAGAMSSSAMSTAIGVRGGTSTGGDLVNTMLNSQKHVTSTGKIDATCMFNLSMQCYYIYELAAFQEPSLYNHTYGKPCNLTKRIGSLQGFTQISPETDLSGISATRDEIEELRTVLSTGFYA